MGLIQVASHTVVTGSEVLIVILSGIDTENVHLLVGNNIQVGSAGGICDIHATVSGTANTDSDVGINWMDFKTSGTYQVFGNATQDPIRVTDGMNVVPYSTNFYMYLYNWYSSSKYSYATMKESSHNGSNLRGYQQGAVKKATTSFDGVRINTNNVNGWQDGTQFTLYKVV